MSKFEIWKDSGILVQELNTFFTDCPDSIFKFKIQGTAVAVMSALGNCYYSQSEDVLYHYLTVAWERAEEMMKLCQNAHKTGYLDEDQFSAVNEKSLSLKRRITALINETASWPFALD